MSNSTADAPRLVVFTTLFPSPVQPNAGLFIRERMFRVGSILPLVVVAPAPWFPFQSLIRIWKPHFRPSPPFHETQHGIEVFHPRFLSIPGIFKSLDGIFLALSSLRTMRKLKKSHGYDVIDAHFGYPDGYAATWLGRWLHTPVTITLRGTEVRHAKNVFLRGLLRKALFRATRLFSVSSSLKHQAVQLGVSEDKITVVGNGVDIQRFYPVDRETIRAQVGIPDDARVMITVGGLVERKGFHRVIDVMPKLLQKVANLHYLIVGGASAEGDWSSRLENQVCELGLEQHVHFMGSRPPDQLNRFLSAADIFVLATRNEGWANVILEAMACGLPVVATDVGGNSEVICREELGTIVPFGDVKALEQALYDALSRNWDRDVIIAYARENSWDHRVGMLVNNFRSITRRMPPSSQ